MIDQHTLGHDGWEYAGAYHYITTQADAGTFIMVMPDVTVDHGNGPEIPLFKMPGLTKAGMTLLSPFRNIRAYGYIGFAVGAHKYAEKVGAKVDGSTSE